jgi:hypothetical protein
MGSGRDSQIAWDFSLGSAEGDYRRRTHEVSRTPRRGQRPEAPVETITAQAQSANEPAPYIPSPAFAAAYAAPHNEIGPILTRWNDRGIAEWLLPVNAGRVLVGGRSQKD